MGIKFNDKALSKIEKANESKDKNNNIKVSQTIIKLLRYKRLTKDENNFLVLSDDTFAEMLQVEGLGLETLSPVQVTNVLNNYLQFLRRYLDDITYITSLYPVEIARQRSYWIRKFDKAKNETQRHYIDDRIAMLDATHEQKSNQEYTLIVFADTIQNLKDNLTKIRNWGGGAVKTHKISRQKKIDKLEQLNNMNTGSRGE